MVTSSFLFVYKANLIVILVVEVLHENATHQTLDPSLYPHLIIICCLFCFVCSIIHLLFKLWLQPYLVIFEIFIADVVFWSRLGKHDGLILFLFFSFNDAWFFSILYGVASEMVLGACPEILFSLFVEAHLFSKQYSTHNWPLEWFSPNITWSGFCLCLFNPCWDLLPFSEPLFWVNWVRLREIGQNIK